MMFEQNRKTAQNYQMLLAFNIPTTNAHGVNIGCINI